MTRNIRWILSVLSLAGLLAGLLPAALGAQGPALEGAIPDGPAVVRLYAENRDHLNAVAGELDIWETHQDLGYVVALVTPEQYAWLEGLGYRLEVDAERTEALGIQAPLDPRFYYFDDDYANPNGLYIVDFLQDINTAYPGLTELIDIGDAWQGQNGGYLRDMWVLRISNEDPAYGPIEEKPAFFLFADIHAREVATPELAIRYIRYLTEGYGGEGGYGIDPDVTWLVDWNVAYVLVMQNPDGHRVDEANTGTMWRKNVNNNECPTGSYGIDLNRNHSFLWGCCGGSSGNPCSETYRGVSRGSEPETEAFESYFATVMEDQNGPNGEDEIPPASPITTTGIFISLHSYSDLVLWPWGFDNYGPAPNDAQLATIGRKFALFTNFDPMGTIWYDVDGATDDWTYGMFGVASFTFEVGPDYGSCGNFFPAYECIDGTGGYPQNFWAETRPAFLYAHKIARTPYMTAYGPDAENVTATPATVLPGAPVELSATITDHRYGADPLQPIYGAEYFVDMPGEDGAGTPLLPADGSWGGLTEDVVATVDTSGWEPGLHYLLVHGLNDDGDWGPFTAVFLQIEGGPCAGVQIEAVLTETVACTVTFSAELSGTLPYTYSWDLASFGVFDTPSVTVDFGLSGSYPYTLTVENCGGAGSDTASGMVTVSCEAPCEGAHNAAFTYTPTAPMIFHSVLFTATVSGTSPFTYSWDLGDGSAGSGMVTTHTYSLPGVYSVTLTVANCGGAGQDTVVQLLGVGAFRIYLPVVHKQN